MIKRLKNTWSFFSDIGVHSALASREVRITHLINRFAFAIVISVLFSFAFQIIKHLIFSGEFKLHSFLMVITFAPYILAFAFNHFRKYNYAKLTIILYTLINHLFWTFTNVGQDSRIYYANLILAIPIVIFFRRLRDQVILIVITFIFFAISYTIDLNYTGYIINTYQNSNFNIMAFGIWIIFSFIMMRFFLAEIEDVETALRKQNNDLEDFTRLASHDMKEPLRNIVSFSSLIKSKHINDIPKEAETYLTYIEEGASRLNNLLDGLSTYNQIEIESEEKLKEVDLNLILKNLKRDLNLSIEDSNAKIDSDLLPKIKATPAHMHQLFQNLISNGIKFQPKELGHTPRINIEYKLIGGYHQLKFVDNGIGILKENISKVFQKFKRLHGRKEFDGTGLGLATCEKIVELYNGNIRIHPDSNHGTTVIVSIPSK